MALLDELVGRVKRYEGFRERAYGDYGQHAIGFGIATNNPNEVITQEEADRRLRVRAQQEIDAVREFGQKHGYNWNDNQIGALADFRFNVGNIDQLTANGTRTNEQIAAMMPEYNKAGGEVKKGLVNRRNEGVQWFNSGQPIQAQPQVQPQQTAQIAPTAVSTAPPAFMPSVADQAVQQPPVQPPAQQQQQQQVAAVPERGIRQFQQQDPLTMFRYLSNQQQGLSDMGSWLRS